MIRYFSTLLLGIAATQSFAATTLTTTPKATATLTSSCQISANNIDIGEIGGASQLKMTTQSNGVSILCNNGAAYTVRLNGGNNVSGTNGRRLLGQISGEKIAYTVCRTASWTTSVYSSGNCTAGPWYTNGGVDYPITGTGTGTTQVLQTVGIVQTGYYTPDIYTDILTLTISF